jgi:hypothetical protein
VPEKRPGGGLSVGSALVLDEVVMLDGEELVEDVVMDGKEPDFVTKI